MRDEFSFLSCFEMRKMMELERRIASLEPLENKGNEEKLREILNDKTRDERVCVCVKNKDP